MKRKEKSIQPQKDNNTTAIVFSQGWVLFSIAEDSDQALIYLDEGVFPVEFTNNNDYD